MTGHYERHSYRRSAGNTVKRGARRLYRAVCDVQNDFYVLVAGIVLGIFVFIGCNLSVAASRGFNGGIGGELILAIAVAFGVNFIWHKIKKHLSE